MFRKTLKNIFTIYKRDMKKVVTNWVAIIILTGLSLLPSLYAWVNIGASWDPYSNTSGIKVGIVNQDKGATLKGNDVEIGQTVSESLKENKKLGWVFFDNAEEGISAAEKGQVYATIIIPEDFSRDLSTVLDDEPVKPKLEYYVNEKINAIAPKMTDSGVTTIQRQITTSFVDTAIEKGFEIFNKVGIQLNDYYPQIEKYKVQLFEVDENFPNLYEKIDKIMATSNNGLVQLDSKNQDINDVQKILEKTIGFMDDINGKISTGSENLSNDAAKLRENVALVQSLSSNISKTTKELEESVIKNKPEVINSISNSIEDLEDLSSKLDTTATKVEKAGIDVSGKIKEKSKSLSDSITEDIGLLKNLKEAIISNQADVNTVLTSIIDTNTAMATQIADLTVLIDNSFDNADKVLKNMETVCDNVDKILVELPAQTEATKTQVNNLINTAQDEIKNLQSKYPTVPFSELSTLLTTIQDSVNNGATEQQMEALIKNLSNLNAESKKAIKTLEEDGAKQRVSIDNTLAQMEETTKAVSRLCTNLQNTMNANIPDIIKKLDSTMTKLDTANTEIKVEGEKLSASVSEDSANIAYNFRKIPPKLDELKNALTTLKDKVQNNDNVEQALSDISELTFNLDTASQKVIAGLDGNVVPMVESYLKNSSIFVLDIRNVISSTNRNLDQFKDLLTLIHKNGQISLEELNNIKDKLPDVQKNIHDMTGKIKEFEKTASLQDIIDVLKKDGNKEGAFISQPVELNSHKLYAMANYGAAMTPFYSTLSLWVGALLLTALLSTKAKNVDFKATAKEEFFGKYLFFATFAFFQGLVVCLGDVFVLGVKAQQPSLLIFLGVFTSLVFTMIVYSLVSIFGNVGKAIGVVFMVIQLAGSGGTFPIEVTPTFFQIVYSMLPFTYAISAMREAIGGVVYGNLLKDLSVLIGYFVLFMMIGITLKKWVNIILHKLNHKLAESGVVEH